VRDLLAYPQSDLDMATQAGLTNMQPVFVRKLSQLQAGRAFFGIQSTNIEFFLCLST
jgi:hypothetical protein